MPGVSVQRMLFCQGLAKVEPFSFAARRRYADFTEIP
jgi:hypothetical protein